MKVREYDLELTMYPSFTSVLYERTETYTWYRAYGYGKGAVIQQRENELIIDLPPEVSTDVIDTWLGLWFHPKDYLHEVSKALRPIIEYIADTYSVVRIPYEFTERWRIFIAVFLSRRTDYHTNVEQWCRAMFREVEKPTDLENYNFTKIKGSYQLRQLSEVYSKYLREVYSREEEVSDFYQVKKLVLTLKWVGPKTANAYILFTRPETRATPCDIHYQRFVQKLQLFKNYKLPDKKLCLSYTCENCPQASTCLEAQSRKQLGRLSGWVQTIAYIHDSLYCSKNRCRECPINKLCTQPHNTEKLRERKYP